jgi:hypothetical protein
LYTKTRRRAPPIAEWEVIGQKWIYGEINASLDGRNRRWVDLAR